MDYFAGYLFGATSSIFILFFFCHIKIRKKVKPAKWSAVTKIEFRSDFIFKTDSNFTALDTIKAVGDSALHCAERDGFGKIVFDPAEYQIKYTLIGNHIKMKNGSNN